jgi:hypothetical protein
MHGAYFRRVIFALISHPHLHQSSTSLVYRFHDHHGRFSWTRVTVHKLPISTLELRDNIYCYSLLADHRDSNPESQIHICQMGPQSLRLYSTGLNINMNLLHISRQVSEVSLDILYGENTFMLDLSRYGQHAYNKLTTDNLRRINRFRITIMNFGAGISHAPHQET